MMYEYCSPSSRPSVEAKSSSNGLLMPVIPNWRHFPTSYKTMWRQSNGSYSTTIIGSASSVTPSTATNARANGCDRTYMKPISCSSSPAVVTTKPYLGSDLCTSTSSCAWPKRLPTFATNKN